MPLKITEALSEVVDCDQLVTRCLNNLDFAERMLTLYENKCGEELVELERALDRGDLEAVRKIAHRFAGASANAAAFSLQAKASELRHAADAGSSQKATDCMTQLRQEWSRFTAALCQDQAVHAC